MQPEGSKALYVRLPAGPTRRLEEAVAASGKSKRQLVEEAVRLHLGDDLVVGRATLREPPPEVLTPEEAALLLRIPEPDLLEAAESGELPGRRIAGDWRFARAALLAWLDGATSDDRA